MKKYISLVLLFVLIVFFSATLVYGKYSSKDIYRKLNFSEDESEPNANKILYDDILKEQNMNLEKFGFFVDIAPEAVRAFEVDLNDDGTNEVIGFVYSTYYWGTAGYGLFILQKQPDGYKDIALAVNFEPQKVFYIFNSKTNGYRDIKLYGSFGYDGKPFIVKYKNGYYQSDYQIKNLERILQQ